MAVPEPGPGANDQAWHDWFQEKAAIREFDSGYGRAMAEHLAYGEAISRWHRLNGERPDPACCAGCGKLLSGRETLALPDASRVHFDANFRCLIAYGDRWRSAAGRALAELGVMPPSSDG